MKLPEFTVSDEVYATRVNKCKICPHKTDHLGAFWCGTPVVGNLVKVEGEKKRLCGCNMHAKAKGKIWGCPIGKWKPVKLDRNSQRILVDAAKAYQAHQSQQAYNNLKEAYKQVFGHYYDRNACSSCNAGKKLLTHVIDITGI